MHITLTAYRFRTDLCTRVRPSWILDSTTPVLTVGLMGKGRTRYADLRS